VETKTGRSRRTVDLPVAVVATLRAHRARQSERRLQTPASLVFSRRDGRSPLNGTTVTHALQAALVRAGLPRMRFHDLRHTHASLLIAGGVHPRVIMERLGHSTISTTMDIYGHVFPSEGRAVAAMLDQMFGMAAGVKG
jgi:integrase